MYYVSGRKRAGAYGPKTEARKQLYNAAVGKQSYRRALTLESAQVTVLVRAALEESFTAAEGSTQLLRATRAPAQDGNDGSSVEAVPTRARETRLRERMNYAEG